MSSAVLKAAAHHFGSQCDAPNKEFMLCRWEEKDPRKCLEEGRKVNACALNFFRYTVTVFSGHLRQALCLVFFMSGFALNDIILAGLVGRNDDRILKNQSTALW